MMQDFPCKVANSEWISSYSLKEATQKPKTSEEKSWH
jgi:hypothetical protein